MEEKESLGRYFKRERELKNISLREVSKNTKVKEHLLKAIEEDQYASLPSLTYVKGFLLAYAKYLGLDPEDILIRYEGGLREKPPPRTEVPPEKKKVWKVKFLGVIGGIIFVGIFSIYFFFLHPPTPPIERVAVKPEVVELSPFTSQITAVLSLPEEQPFSLQLKAVEETWVRIQIDGQPDHEMTLKSGESTSHKGLKLIQLLVGNAGGLDIVFKEKLLEKFGKSGEVVDLTFSPQGVELKRHVNHKMP